MEIQSREEVAKLVDTFYEKVKRDEMISGLFAHVDWPKHLPVMYDFWESMIFHTDLYKGNPMVAHMRLHERAPLKAEFFERWLKLFTETVDELFEGEKALLAKQKATSIATVMRIKILHNGVGGS